MMRAAKPGPKTMSVASQTASPAAKPAAKPANPTLGAAAPAAGGGVLWPAGRLIGVGVLLAALLVGGVGGWSAVAMISGAVIAPAELRVEGERKTVQHLEGGVVAEIRVQEGDLVEAGEVLMRLDPTSIATNIEIVDGQLDELTARQFRLEAEMTGAEQVSPSLAFLQRAATRPQAMTLFDGQVALFDARKTTMAARVDQLSGRIAQTQEEISGAEAQVVALDRQLALIGEELAAQQDLLAKGLTEKGRVIALARDEARLAGERGRLLSEIARLKGRISEVEISILEADGERREEAITTLRDLTARVAELTERRTALQQSLDRVEIRAPLAGLVLDMQVNTVGGVVTPAEPLLYIVPTDRRLVVEARVPPLDRDRLWPNQPARIRFVAFNQRSTPELDGVVARIGADKLEDERTGQPYFSVIVAVSEAEFARLQESVEAEIVPGLPAEVHVQTGERTAASYLLKPLTDQLQRAFREE